jgi:hypothetical protein
MQSKAMKNVHGKSQPQQRKMPSKTTKGKQQWKESANPKLPPVMTQANPKFVMGQLMLTVDVLQKAGQPCVELHNYYINNYKSGQDIVVSYKDHDFLVGDDFFLNALSVIPHSKKEGTKPPYVCPGCSNHMYSNNMITRIHVQ